MSTPVPVVFANTTCSFLFNGQILRVVEDQPWHANDPLVRAKPELFSPSPRRLLHTAPIEAATANPGERRTVRRG